eukprot:TRINITY_DN6711_c0_g1_i1.p1 TRINITY_DN6711_c0_g1~~TRINITY_DN6711_c0_g1_i1.p1  ORF type:complete len:205 (+),score=11.54 TRINITY_DN6711_c0_g1_i1:86-700(+)
MPLFTKSFFLYMYMFFAQVYAGRKGEGEIQAPPVEAALTAPNAQEQPERKTCDINVFGAVKNDCTLVSDNATIGDHCKCQTVQPPIALVLGDEFKPLALITLPEFNRRYTIDCTAVTHYSFYIADLETRTSPSPIFDTHTTTISWFDGDKAVLDFYLCGPKMWPGDRETYCGEKKVKGVDLVKSILEGFIFDKSTRRGQKPCAR